MLIRMRSERLFYQKTSDQPNTIGGEFYVEECPTAFGFAISASIFATDAHAADTKYTHYLIAGESAASLKLSMMQKGPRVQAGHAYASTSMEPNIILKTRREVCRVEQFNFNMKFTIVLPKLKKSATLSPALRRSFESFYRSAKKHEDTHRSIWLKCGREIEASTFHGQRVPAQSALGCRRVRPVLTPKKRLAQRRVPKGSGQRNRTAPYR